jgi:HlyD family secretion protein
MTKKKKGKKIILFSVIGFIVIVAVLVVVFSNSEKPIVVTTSKVTLRTISQNVTAIGKIQPETEVKVSSEAAGEIIFLGPREGDSVKMGQILVRVKPDIIETQLEQFKAAADGTKMEINIRKAEKDRLQSELQRLTELYEKEYVSKQDFERAKSTYDQALSSYRASLSHYDQAVATLKQFQRSADRTTIFSPINGIVTKLDVERGEKVVGTAQFQGTELMRISNLNVMNAVVDVDENDIVLVKIGDTAEIEIDAFPNRIFKGVVYEIGHSAKQNQLGTQDQVTNFEVKVRILDKELRLRPGMSCSVDIVTETKYNVLSVPLQAVTVRKKDDQANIENSNTSVQVTKEKEEKASKPKSIVFMRDGNKAKVNNVETGISDKGFIEITKGLKLNDVVISGSYMAISKQLSDGSKISIEQKDQKKQSKK